MTWNVYVTPLNDKDNLQNCCSLILTHGGIFFTHVDMQAYIAVFILDSIGGG